MKRLTHDQLLDNVARIAMCIQRGGDDFMGPVEGIHQNFISILEHIKSVEHELETLKQATETIH